MVIKFDVVMTSTLKNHVNFLLSEIWGIQKRMSVFVGMFLEANDKNIFLGR